MKPIYFTVDRLNYVLAQYYSECDHYPSNTEGIQELVRSDKACWQGPYIRERNLINHHCGHEYRYKRLDKGSIEITDPGLDCIYDTDDDLNYTDSASTRQIKLSQYRQTKAYVFWLKTIALLVSTLVFLFVVQLFYQKVFTSEHIRKITRSSFKACVAMVVVLFTLFVINHLPGIKKMLNYHIIHLFAVLICSVVIFVMFFVSHTIIVWFDQKINHLTKLLLCLSLGAGWSMAIKVFYQYWYFTDDIVNLTVLFFGVFAGTLSFYVLNLRVNNR